MRTLHRVAVGVSVIFCAGMPDGRAARSNPPEHGLLWNLQTDVSGPLKGEYTFMVEHWVGEGEQLGLIVSYLSTGFGDISQRTVTVGARANFALGGDGGTDNWYLSPSLKYHDGSFEAAPGRANELWGSVGLIFGYHLIFDNGLNLRMGSGVSYGTVGRTLRVDTGREIAIPAFGGVFPLLELTAGYAF